MKKVMLVLGSLTALILLGFGVGVLYVIDPSWGKVALYSVVVVIALVLVVMTNKFGVLKKIPFNGIIKGGIYVALIFLFFSCGRSIATRDAIRQQVVDAQIEEMAVQRQSPINPNPQVPQVMIVAVAPGQWTDWIENVPGRSFGVKMTAPVMVQKGKRVGREIVAYKDPPVMILPDVDNQLFVIPGEAIKVMGLTNVTTITATRK